LNNLGRIAEEEWLRTKEIRSNIDLDYYVVMPNHFHGIIILKDYVETCRCVPLRRFDRNIVFITTSYFTNS